MSVPRINIKNIDYFKFKKLVVDGVRDDYAVCSKEVKALCDCVQTLNFRDEEFDDVVDRERFEDICSYYKQIMCSKRIESTDMRIKSGWWGDHKNAYSAGKLKPGVLKDALLEKTKQWTSRFGGPLAKLSDSAMATKLDGPGLFVLKHKEHQCFQYVGRADKIFARVGEKLKAAFEGMLHEPLAALLVISMASDWEFYFIPILANDDERVLRVLENDLILKHDSIWPHGLNFRLHIDSLLEVSEFRKSCLRHNWPPESDSTNETEIDLGKLRQHILTLPPPDDLEYVAPPPATPPTPAKKKPKARPPSPIEIPPDVPTYDDFDVDEEELQRSPSAMSSVTYIVNETSTAPVPPTSLPLVAKNTPAQQPPRPTSAGRKREPKTTNDRPKSAGRPTAGRDRPTTPKKIQKPTARRPNQRTTENDLPSYDSSSLDRSASANSLSSTDGRQVEPPSPRKTPVRSAKPRPTSGTKTRPGNSRLPVAGSGPLRHQNRD